MNESQLLTTYVFYNGTISYSNCFMHKDNSYVVLHVPIVAIMLRVLGVPYGW